MSRPDGKKDGDVYYNVSFSYVSEFTPGAQFKSNDPSFSRDHFKYPIQHFLILNYDSDSGLNGTNATINNRLYIDLATDSPKRYREGQTPIGFTTEAGGVVELLVSLVEEPNWETEKITFFIFTSDATEGVVKYPTLVAFTHQNWDIPQPVFIEGMFDEEQDGDITYNISFNVHTEYSRTGFITNDPGFSGLHWRYPVQSILLVNEDTYGPLRHGTLWNESHYRSMHGGNIYSDLTLRSRLNVTLANQSNAFTTEAGHVTELRARLDTPVYEGFTVTYGITTSDTTEATVKNPTLVFDSKNWDVEVPVVIRGEWDRRPDGDVPYTVDFTLLTSEDPLYNRRHYKDPGISFPLINIDSWEGTRTRTRRGELRAHFLQGNVERWVSTEGQEHV